MEPILSHSETPIYYKTFVTAVEEAKELSRNLPEKCIYIFHISTGGYWVDDTYSNYNELIMTLLNGEKTL